MKQWTEFYDLTLPDLPDCPLPAIDQALREAAIQLCQGADVWRESLPVVKTVKGKSVYEFKLSDQQQVYTLKKVYVAGQEYPVLRPDEFDNYHQGVLCLGSTTFEFVQPSDVADLDIVTDVVLRPSNAAASIPDNLYSEYRDTIAMGARGRLMMSPKKPYTNLNLGADLTNRFKMSIQDANLRAFRGRGQTAPRIQAYYI